MAKWERSTARLLRVLGSLRVITEPSVSPSYLCVFASWREIPTLLPPLRFCVRPYPAQRELRPTANLRSH